MPFAVSNQTIGAAGTLEDSFVIPTASRPNEFTPLNPSVVNVVNVAIAPPAPTTSNLATTIEYAQGIVSESVAEYGIQETPVVITLLASLGDAALLAEYLVRPVPAFWFGNIQVIMNGLTDAQRTIIGGLDIGAQISVTKTFPNSTPSTVTQVMSLEGVSHDITPDRHIVMLYTNPSRIYTYFIVGGYTTTTTRTNLLPDPSCSNASIATYWQAIKITESISTDYAYAGTTSMKGVIDVGTAGQYFQVLQTAGAMIDVVAGQTYTFSAYIYLPASNTANTNWRAELYFWNGTSYTGSNGGTTTTITRGNWTRLTTTATVPAGYYKALPRIAAVSTLAVGQIAYVDAWLLETGSTLLPYFDGTYADTYTGYTLTSQQWNGIADASTSTGTWGLDSSFVGSELDDETKALA